MRLPPARNLATDNGALPAARRLTISLRDEPMEIGRGICAALIRCCTLRPEGPAAVPFGKENRKGRMLKSGPRESGVEGTSGGVGRGELGCFDLSSSQVALLRGASPSDKSILQALPCRPIFAKGITESNRLLEFLCLCCDGALRTLDPARFQRVLNSSFAQRSHKTLIGVCLKWRPLLFREGRTHFGNMKSFNQASSEFSSKTDRRVDESALAKLGLAFLGTNRNVGHLS